MTYNPIHTAVTGIVDRLRYDPNPNWGRAVGELVALINDEKTRSYTIGVADQRGREIHAGMEAIHGASTDMDRMGRQKSGAPVHKGQRL